MKDKKAVRRSSRAVSLHRRLGTEKGASTRGSRWPSYELAKSLFLVLAILLTLFHSSPVAKVKALSSISITPTKDTYVSQSSPASNYGEEYKLVVRSYDGGNMRTLLEFSIANMTDAYIINATLILYCYHEPPSNRTYLVSRITGSWEENTVTWNNQPNITGQKVLTTAPNETIWWSVNVKPLLLSGEAIIAFRIEDFHEGDAESKTTYFYSREDINQKNPVLLIYYMAESPEGVGWWFTSTPFIFWIASIIIVIMASTAAVHIFRRKRKKVSDLRSGVSRDYLIIRHLWFQPIGIWAFNINPGLAM